MSDQGANTNSWFDDDANYDIGQDEVLRDGYIPPTHAQRLWRTWSATLTGDRNLNLLKMAISCCAGTSAETNFSERLLDEADPKSAVSRFVDSMMDDKYLRLRTNKLRVWARSMPDFAMITRRVIMKNGWLARQRAAEYDVDVQYAGVCFDYSDVLALEDINMTVTETQIVKFGLRHKAGEGRSAVHNAEGRGVAGSKPSDRGVAESIAPDASRMLGHSRGSGPFA